LQWKFGKEFAALSSRVNRLSHSDLAFSIVSFHEQALALHNYIDRSKKSRDHVHGYGMMTRLLNDFTASVVLPFDTVAAAVFDRLRSQRIRLATIDTRIAAIALSNGLVLLTRNLTDFRNVPGLVTEDWTV
jgi:tRNA(fMet)-specific endonuclease VapC